MVGAKFGKPSLAPRTEIQASASARARSSALALEISGLSANSCFLCCKRNSSCCQACCSLNVESLAVKGALFAAAAILELLTELHLEDLELALELALDFWGTFDVA